MDKLSAFMNEALRIGAGVATPLGLAGLLVAAGLIAWYLRLRHQQKQLQSLPPDQRAHKVDEMLSRYRLDASNLTRDQKYNLLVREMNQRTGNIRLVAIIIGVVILVCFAFATASYVWGAGPPPPAAAPVSFLPIPCERWASPLLPPDVFGAVNDPGRSRHWMKNTELGACAELGMDPCDASLMWYLSEDTYPNGLAPFSLHVCVGTDGNAIVLAYLLLPGGFLKIVPLSHLDPEGPRAEYVFSVPETRSPTRILVFVGMKVSTYDEIKMNPKFQLRSQPLPPG